MGKEWYLGGRSSKSKRSSGHVVIDRDTNISTNTTTTSAGCMCAVFQLFDFHQFQFATNLQHQNEPQPSIFNPTTTTTNTSFELQEEPNIPKGAEAPRNSLKSEDGTSLSSIIEDVQVLESLNNIQMGINQIKTSTSSTGQANSSSLSRSNDFGSDTSSNYSPGTKTPSLVARLMGLDLLPDHHTNSSPIGTHHLADNDSSRSAQAKPLRPSRAHQNKPTRQLISDTVNGPAGTRSLPETPRVSSARRSDVDHHHRLSVQINKENSNVGAEDLDFSRLSSLRRKQLKASHRDVSGDYCYDISAKSPGYYARQIVKQVKESVTRRVGLDITNTVKTRSDHHQHYSRRDYDLVSGNSQAKSAKRSSSSKGSPKLEDQQATVSASSCSPRLRIFSESKTSTTTATMPSAATVVNKDQSLQAFKPTVIISSSSSSSSAKPQKPEREQEKEKEQSKGRSRNNNNNNNKAGNGGGGRRVIRQKIIQEETFVFGPTSATTKNTSSSRRVLGNNVVNPDKSKCKKTPLSNDLLNLNVVPTLVALKKNTKDVVVRDQFVMNISAHKKQAGAGDSDQVAASDDAAQESKRIRSTSLLSCSQSRPAPHVLNPRNTCAAAASDDVVVTSSGTAIAASAEPRGALRRYVTRILGRAGVSATSHVSFTHWFSPSHPVDPSIFHRLEIYYSTYFIHNTNPNSHGQLLSLRCNRRLVFDVVDEILVEILRPFINLKPWIVDYNNNRNVIGSKSNTTIPRNIRMQGSDLIETLCSRVEGFPCKDCQVLGDIDALINEDLRDNHQSLKTQKELMSFEEEGEAVVMEIEKDLVDTLVHETALVLVGNWN